MADLEQRLEDALTFATERHDGQMYGNQPYTVHLYAVIQVARDFELDDNTIIASALHDTLEDTQTTFDELRNRYGPDVATLVHCVTGEGRNRIERQRSIMEKLVSQPDERAVNLKLSDRIANAEAARAEGKTGLLEMYRKEVPLYDAAFRRGNPEMYARLKKALGD